MQEGATFGDPDDAEHSKARALVEYAAWFKRCATGGGFQTATTSITDADDLEIFWWIVPRAGGWNPHAPAPFLSH